MEKMIELKGKFLYFCGEEGMNLKAFPKEDAILNRAGISANLSDIISALKDEGYAITHTQGTRIKVKLPEPKPELPEKLREKGQNTDYQRDNAINELIDYLKARDNK